jgi:hypothetical protein
MRFTSRWLLVPNMALIIAFIIGWIPFHLLTQNYIKNLVFIHSESTPKGERIFSMPFALLADQIFASVSPQMPRYS